MFLFFVNFFFINFSINEKKELFNVNIILVIDAFYYSIY